MGVDIRIIDVTDERAFATIPPCADPGFDHRTCDYWEDADRGLKASRSSWLVASPRPAPRVAPALADNPFAPSAVEHDNPFAPTPGGGRNPFLTEADDAVADNPFAPRPRERPVTAGVPRKLALLDRGRGVFGSYAKVLLADDVAVAYAQFGPLSAYPRALRLRELYPQLPDAPLPAIVTCIATTPDARRSGHALRLVEEVCADLSERGFAAIEAYPDLTRSEDEQSGGRIPLWLQAGFHVAVDDDRFPVVRRDLA